MANCPKKKRSSSCTRSSTLLPQPRISVASPKTLCGWRGSTWVCNYPLEGPWIRGGATLVANIFNTKIHLWITRYLGWTPWIGYTSRCRYSYTRVTPHRWRTWRQQHWHILVSFGRECNRVIVSHTKPYGLRFHHQRNTGSGNWKLGAVQVNPRGSRRW